MRLPKSLANPSALIALPDRVKNFLRAQSGEIDAPYLMPVSCSLIHVKSVEEILIAAYYIKRGAGVKLIFDNLPEVPVPESTETREIYVQDSLLSDPNEKGDLGILESLIEKIKNPNVKLNFSNLRPRGSSCTGGLVASGAESFRRIEQCITEYLKNQTWFNCLNLVGTINEVMIQGGFKKGIIIASLPAIAPTLEEYLEVDIAQLPGSVKREVRFPANPDEAKIDWDILSSKEKNLIVDCRNLSSLFLARERYDKFGNKIFTNVCEGIYLNDRGTCLIVRVPLHKLEIKEIPEAFKAAYKFAANLHKYWHKLQKTQSIDPFFEFAAEENDRQIAVDVMGLANLLHRYGVRYRNFTRALKSILDGEEFFETDPGDRTAHEIANTLIRAYVETAKIVDSTRFDRVFTVEPSQSHAFRETDPLGFTCARGIWPSWDKQITRVSDRYGEQVYSLPPSETMIDNPELFDLVDELNHLWWRMMRKTGYAHAISADTYRVWDKEKIENWLGDPWMFPSFYYQFHDLVPARKTVEVNIAGLDFLIEENTQSCSLDPTQGKFCEVCGA